MMEKVTIENVMQMMMFLNAAVLVVSGKLKASATARPPRKPPQVRIRLKSFCSTLLYFRMRVGSLWKCSASKVRLVWR